MTETRSAPETEPRRSQPGWIVPEVVQSSSMDCGPASLKALLEGFGTRVSYGRLREACQTDVDGTSIDSLEVVARQLGLDAEQIMVPVDHLLLSEAETLPAILVVRLANGNTHFVVAWRRHPMLGLVQIMDPGTGRVWQSERQFLDRCFVHEHQVPASAWRHWASTDEFLAPLRRRIEMLGTSARERQALLDAALEDPGWRGLASLDAAVRLTRALYDAGGLRKAEAARVLPQLVAEARTGGLDAVPKGYWSVAPVELPAPDGSEGEDVEAAGEPETTGHPEADEPETVMLRGAVLVRIRGRALDPPDGSAALPSGAEGSGTEKSSVEGSAAGEGVPELSRELVAALEEETPSPWSTLWDLARAGGAWLPGVLLASSVVAAAGVMLEALVLRAIFELGPLLGSAPERWKAVAMWVGLAALLLGLRRPVLQSAYGLGRRLEVRLRVRFLDKITRLPHRYFASRLVSDMAERSHAVHRLRELPLTAERLCRGGFQLLFTVLGILWLDPGSWPWALAAATASVAMPLATYPLLAERDLKARSHAGALSRFYLDGLLGLTAVRAHAAERSVRREHENLLREWRTASESVLRVSVIGQGLQTLTGFVLAAALLVDHLQRSGMGGGVLLLVYWALRLPEIGNDIFGSVRQLPGLRSTVLRLMEPLDAPEEESVSATVPGGETTAGGAASVDFEGVSVVAGGHDILRAVDLRLDPGEHAAVVGPSGAGKSTLVGLLLGRHRPADGRIRVDGEPLDAAGLERLRRHTAWVDPAVQLWNRSLFDNLRYGLSADEAVPLAEVLAGADLESVIERLPEGLSTGLGEGGGLVSGGEGQRVRLGRAIGRGHARLAVLDEPFRGLDGGTRRRLLGLARERWRDTTLLCVTHDVTDTVDFPRVLVVDEGHLVEDGDPRTLLADPASRYARLVRGAEEAEARWRDRSWRRWWVADGALITAETSVDDVADEGASP